MKPLLASLNLQHVDLFSITPGFWQIHRDITRDDNQWWTLVKAGASPPALTHLQRNSSLAEWKVKEWGDDFETILYKIGRDFATTTVVFRAIHQYLGDYQWISNYDHLTRAVVDRIIKRSMIEKEKIKFFARFQRKIKSKVGEEIDLGSRLVIDNWASLIGGKRLTSSTLFIQRRRLDRDFTKTCCWKVETGR